MPLRIASTAVAAAPAFSARRPIAGKPGPSRVAHDRDERAGEAPGEVVDVTFEPMGPMGERTAATWVASPGDVAAEVSVALASERRVELGDYGHRHDPGGCGFCRRAVAAYR